MFLRPLRSDNGTRVLPFFRLPLIFLMVAANACSQREGGEEYFKDSLGEEYVDASRKLDAPFEPTSMKVVRELLDLGAVGPDDFLIDLGSGDGRIVITAAKEYGARGMGVDLNEDLVVLSRNNAVAQGVEHKTEFSVRDIFKTDIHEASVVTIYLLNDVSIRLRPKFLAELKPGSRIISHDFHMGEWRPDKTLHLDIKKSYQEDTVLYLWIVPARVFGTWSWTLSLAAEHIRSDIIHTYLMQLNQNYQHISGVVTSGQFKVRVFDASLTGDQIQFSVFAEADGRMIQQDYVGRVQGNTIIGTVRLRGTVKETTLEWQASRVGS